MAKSTTKTGASPDAPVVAGPGVAGPVVPLVSAGRVGVDPSLTGKDRRYAERAATAPLKRKKRKALHGQLDTLVADAAELGLHLVVDRDALAVLTAQQPTPAQSTPAPAAPPAMKRAEAPAETPAEPPAPRAAKRSPARPAERTSPQPPARRGTRATPESPPAAASAPRRRAPATRTTPVRTPARRSQRPGQPAT